MPEQVLKRFEFGANVTKVWKDNTSGKYYLKAIASDTGVDYHGERFSEAAIDGMVNCVKNNTPAPVILLPTHWDTFEIGKAVDAQKIDSPTHASLKALEVTFELDMEYPQAKSLYNEVESGSAQKQLSVGGYLNPDNDDSYEWERKEYETDDGNKFYDYILVMNDLLLDHVAVTRKDQAANPRTGFLDAVAKSLIGPKPELPNTINKEVGRMSQADKQAQSLMDVVSKSILGFFKSNDASQQKVNAAVADLQKAAQALKDVNGDNGEGLSGMDVTSLFGPSFQEIANILGLLGNTNVGQDGDNDNIPGQTEFATTQEQTNPAETQAAVTDDDKNKSTITSPVDVDALKSSIVSDVMKSLGENQAETFKQFAKSMGEAVGSALKSAVDPLTQRINELESFSGKSKSLGGQEGVATTNVAKSSTEGQEGGDIWKGMFEGAIPFHVIAEKKFEQGE